MLVGAASVVLLAAAADPRVRRRSAGRARTTRTGRPRRRPSSALFAVAVYGGYFGAAAGVLMLALLLVGLPVTLLRANALKNVLLGLANATAAVGFAFTGPVDWRAGGPMAVGLLAGSWLGPALARRLPATALRIGIGVAGLGLAASVTPG